MTDIKDRRIFKTFLSVILIVSMIFAMAGCGSSDGSSASAGDESTSEGFLTVDYSDSDFSSDSIPDPVTKESDDTLTITDCIGRETEVPRNPERIAVLDSFAGEAVVMIGAGDIMVTCPNGTKSDRLLCEICPSLTEKEVIMSEGTFNAEALLELKPDLIIIKKGLYTSDEERSKLEKLNIPYLVSDYGNMAEQMYALRMIGCAAGGEYESKAEEIIDYYCEVIKKVESRASKIPDSERKTVYHSINEAVRTDGEYSLGNDWITATGATDVSAQHTGSLQKDKDDYYAEIEQIFSWDPDVVICNEAETKDYLLTDSKWSSLRAVREGSVYNIPVGATRWGQRGSLETFFAMLWLGTTIYPDYFSDIDLKSEVVTFYSDVLNLTIDDATYQQILSGTGIRNASQASGS